MIVNEDKFKIQSVAKDILNSKKLNVSFVPPKDDDTLSIASSYNGIHQSVATSYMTNDNANNYSRAIQDCRLIALQPLIKKILDYIEIEAFPVSSDVTGRTTKINVKMDTDDLQDYLSDDIISEIKFSYLKFQKLLKFKVNGSKLFRSWYIDGRQAFHAITEKNEGIVELREIDVLNLRKIRKEIKEKVDGVDVVTDYEVKYIYTPKKQMNQLQNYSTISNHEIEIDESAVIYITSGLTDEFNSRTVSHLEPLIKPVMNLSMIEDAHMITRLANAAQTRVIYVDIGQHASNRAEEIISKVQAKFRHNAEYDVKTGRLRDNRRYVSVLNDIFIPRLSNSGNTTEIKTLPNDDNVDKINSLEYFKNDLIEKTIVPKQRLTSNQSFSMGKSNELSRDETIFHKQIESLRQRYSILFHEFIKKDLIVRNVMSGEEYDLIRDEIYFIFPTDNYYKMLLEFELFDEKISRIQAIGHDPVIFYGIEKTAKEICGFTDEETKEAIERWKQDNLLKLQVQLDNTEIEVNRMKEIDPEALESTSNYSIEDNNLIKLKDS